MTPALQDRMGRDEAALIEDADRVRKLMHFDDAPRPIGHAVVIAADRDEPVMADAPFELEERVEGRRRQRLKLKPFGREGLRDDPLRGAVQPDVGDRVEPVLQLLVQVLKAPERARQEEVLADVGNGRSTFPLVLARYGRQALGRKPKCLASAISERL